MTNQETCARLSATLGNTTSRSRRECGFRCNRKRYWRYEHAGTGLLGPDSNIRASLGIALHEILASTLEGKPDINKGVETFLSLDRGAEPWEFNHKATLEEHEFFIRTVAEVAIPAIVSRLRQDYNVILVEGKHIPDLAESAKWYSREDAILLDRTGERRWVFSFKTVQDYQPWKHLNVAKYLMQNKSEPWACRKDGYDVAGEIMLWLEVGALKEDRDRGCYIRESSYCRPYINPETEEWFWQYRWTDANGHTSQVPKGVHRHSMRDYLTVDEWIKTLKTTEVPIGDGFFGPVVFEANEDQIKHWETQTVFGETRLVEEANMLAEMFEKGDIENWSVSLDKWRPQNELECNGCSFPDLCWGPPDVLTTIGTKYQLKEKRVREAEPLEVEEII